MALRQPADKVLCDEQQKRLPQPREAAWGLFPVDIMRLYMQSNIKAKPPLPRLLKRISLLDTLFTRTAQGIYPFILVPHHMYEDLQSARPNPYSLALIVHEQTHLDRQSQVGFVKWMAFYAVSPRFRFGEEIEAIKVQMKFLKGKGLIFPIETTAELLSSWLYLQPVGYETALQALKLAWEEA
jgi:hypothetical protein